MVAGMGVQAAFFVAAVCFTGVIPAVVGLMWPAIDPAIGWGIISASAAIGLTSLVVALALSRWARRDAPPAESSGRRLTDKQRKQLRDTLSSVQPKPGEFSLIYNRLSADCALFASELAETMNAAGWQVAPDVLALSDRLHSKGLTLAAPDIQNKPKIAAQLAQALAAVGLKFRWQEHDIDGVRLYVDPD